MTHVFPSITPVIGSGLLVLEGPALLMSRWQSVSLTIREKAVVMLVNNDQVSGVVPGSSTMLTLGTPLYVGGANILQRGSLHPNLGFTRGYTGCIHSIQVYYY